MLARNVWTAICLGLALTGHAVAAAPTFPGATWEQAAPVPGSACATGLAAIPQAIADLPTTSLMVVVGGRVLYQWGEISEVSYLASARKSILSMLFGRAIATGLIRLDENIGSLGIDDVGGLLPIEKTATVQDLLTSRSGVFHDAGSPGGDTSAVPPRGSQRPGTYWMYNNWDFNVVGAIYEKQTSRSVFDAFAAEFAAPLQLQDFDRSRQRMLGDPKSSQFLAYHFFLSGRDMARLGLLMVRHGNWSGKQIITADWVAESTRLKVPVSEMHGPASKGTLGYADLWWVPQSDQAGRDGPDWQGSFLANGNYGQFILALPALDMVIVHRRAVTDKFAVDRNLGLDNSTPIGVSAERFMKLADQIVAARCAVPAP
jgi:CubicO group peptidase (beta-lactamase class C family)